MANPTGTPRKIQIVDDYVVGKIKEWHDNLAGHSSHWWQPWKKDKVAYEAAKFVICMVDDLVLLVQEQALNADQRTTMLEGADQRTTMLEGADNNTTMLEGADKKATVLAALDVIYDCVIVVALPIWMKPFSKQIRILLVDVVISEMIDFFVNKYKTGVWGNSKGFLPVQA